MLRNRVAVVTGGASGIGAAHVRALASAGATTVIGDVDVAKAKATAASVGGDTVGLPLDVSDVRSVTAFFQSVEKEHGRLDILVNNAALVLAFDRPFKPFWEIELAEWQRTFSVNTEGIFLCCKAAKPIMQRTGGSVINMVSDAIWAAYPGQLAYFASKGAVDTMTRCLARELGPFGIRVNAVAPGLTLSQSALENETIMSFRSKIVDERALQKDQSPDEVAAVMLFLASEAAAAVSGHVIVANSGGLMR